MVNVPPGQIGDWRVNKFVVEANDALAAYYGLFGRPVPPGVYTRLLYKHDVIMSDTPAEIADHMEVISKAAGRVLLNGLGLGVVLQAILEKSEVSHVDVVEISSEVVQLVSPHYPDPRVTIHHADAFTIQWPNNTRWDIVWHDIWPTISSDNLPEMTRLHKKYAGRCGWQGSWLKESIRQLVKRGVL